MRLVTLVIGCVMLLVTVGTILKLVFVAHYMGLQIYYWWSSNRIKKTDEALAEARAHIADLTRALQHNQQQVPVVLPCPGDQAWD